MVRASVSVARLLTRRGTTTANSAVRAASRHAALSAPARPVGAMGTVLLRHCPAGPIGAVRSVSSTSKQGKGIMPESEDPRVKELEEETAAAVAAVELSDAEYHALADSYLETVLSRLEQLQDEREDVDVEYAAGVLTVTFLDAGTYVINKQPPNKQIWLSSPKSGPKRYDWVIIGDGQHQKQGTGTGDWIYLKDMTSLNDLFLAEIGVDLSMPIPHYGE